MSRLLGNLPPPPRRLSTGLTLQRLFLNWLTVPALVWLCGVATCTHGKESAPVELGQRVVFLLVFGGPPLLLTIWAGWRELGRLSRQVLVTARAVASVAAEVQDTVGWKTTYEFVDPAAGGKAHRVEEYETEKLEAITVCYPPGRPEQAKAVKDSDLDGGAVLIREDGSLETTFRTSWARRLAALALAVGTVYAVAVRIF